MPNLGVTGSDDGRLHAATRLTPNGEQGHGQYGNDDEGQGQSPRPAPDALPRG
jgi:hypothetical protein